MTQTRQIFADQISVNPPRPHHPRLGSVALSERGADRAELADVVGVVLAHHLEHVAERDVAPVEDALARELVGAKPVERADVVGAGGAERRERLAEILGAVVALGRDLRAVEALELGTLLGEEPPDANAVALELEVAQVARL